MKLKFFGATGEVTGSNFLLERTDTESGEKVQVLVDCGLHQGHKYSEERNYSPFAYNPADIKAVFVTHAHVDHIGKLPKLYKDGFRGKVYSIEPTRDFGEILLLDSEHIISSEAEREGKEPLYGPKDIENLLPLWETVEYDKTIEVEGFKVTFVNAGHILGSSSVIVEADGRSIIFSGDLGNQNPTLIEHFDKIDRPIDYCVMESTYGGRLHKDLGETREFLENIIEETVQAGGTLMIPAFAMERTQRLLEEINDLMENGRIPQVPVFMDSPLAARITEVYKKYGSKYFDAEAKKELQEGERFFKFPGLKMTIETEESKAIKDVPPPKIIIAGSGMSNGGRIIHHERAYLPDPKSTILFIGYQASGTLGRRIYEGEKLVKVFGQEVVVRCRVEAIGGYSAHADQNGLLEWLNPMRGSLKKVFLVHGEPKESTALAVKIRDSFAVQAELPELEQEVELD